MNTGQMLIGIFAIVILMTVMMNFYRALTGAHTPIEDSQYGVSVTSYGTSIIEFAHGLAFDHNTINWSADPNNPDPVPTQPNQLTQPASLGPDGGEPVSTQTNPIDFADIRQFNDFDDFHGQWIAFDLDSATVDIDLGGNNVIIAVCSVFYVDPNNINQRMNTRTFTKRMDLTLYKEDPRPDIMIDTVRMHTVMGFFRFMAN